MKSRKFGVLVSLLFVSMLTLAFFGRNVSVVAQEPPEFTQVPFTEDYSTYPKFFKITLIAPLGNKVREQYAAIMAEELKKIGIETELVMMDFSDLIGREFDNVEGKTYDEGGFDIGFFGWGVGIDPDPEYIFSSKYLIPEGYSITWWINPKADELLVKARLELDQAKRKQFLDEWQEIIYDEQPYSVIYSLKQVYAYDSNLGGFNGDHWSIVGDARPWVPADGDTIVYAQNDDIETTNVYLYGSLYTIQAIGQVFEGLFTRDENLSLVPFLAESATPGPTKEFEIEDVATPLEFPEYFDIKLREGIKFHNGVEMTADDLIFSYDALLSDDLALPQTGQLPDMIEKYEKVGKYTVRVYVKQPHANWLGQISVAVLPKSVYGELPLTGEGSAQAWIEAPHSTGDPTKVIGTGPFKFVEWVKDEFVKLERNEDYWGGIATWGTTPGKAGAKYLIIKPITEASVAQVALENNEVDILDAQYSLNEFFDDLNAKPNITAVTAENFGYQHMHYNVRNPYLANKYVRQACSYMIPRQQIVDELLGGLSVPIANPIAVPSWAYNDNLQPYPYDPVKARETMAKAGYSYWVRTEKAEAPAFSIIAVLFGLGLVLRKKKDN
ncbi:MAG: ABC transporter substrate-binding protein [Candidatus Methanofastidiosia archaeon]